MRVRFGIINLPPRLKRGMQAELGEGEVGQVLEWVGLAGQLASPSQDVGSPQATRATPKPKSKPERTVSRKRSGGAGDFRRRK
jgi:23S rRNA pseudouridine2605 synthase